jgi:hypothetical protein
LHRIGIYEVGAKIFFWGIAGFIEIKGLIGGASHILERARADGRAIPAPVVGPLTLSIIIPQIVLG